MSDPAGDRSVPDGSLLARARRSAGLTQEELAERCGLSVRGIRSLERGEIQRPRHRSLAALATALGLSGDDRDAFIGHYRRHASTVGLGDGPAPDRTPSPAQLPAARTTFTGRTGHLRRLDRMLEDCPRAVVLVTIDGVGGVGKTALATQWAHRRRSAFPDGQLYANFHAYGSLASMEPTVVLARFLRSLGVPGGQLPAELDERAALFRTLLADRQMLVVLDNVRAATQVRPLLPGTPGTMVVVTSRDQLRGLGIRDGARRLRVDPLDSDEAIALLGELVDEQWLGADPTAAAAIVDHCAGLPLALTIAANRVTGADDLSTVAAALIDGDGLGFPHPGDDTANLESVFSWSIGALDNETARLFRLLGLHPGPDASPGVAAALVGSTVEVAHSQLDTLANAHLLDERCAGRYESHDLLRRYAAQLAASDLTATERQSASTQMLDFYLHTALAAADLIQPLDERRRPTLDLPATPAGSFADRDEALAWLDSEQTNLLAVAEQAADQDGPSYTTDLADVLAMYLCVHGHHDAAVALHHNALAASRRRHDLNRESRARADLGVAYKALGRTDLAIEHECQSLTLAREAGNRTEEVRVVMNLGASHGRLGQYGDAITYLRQSLEMAIEDGNAVYESEALASLGLAYRYLGQHVDAVETFLNCLAVARRSGNQLTEARTLSNLGDTHRRRGQYDEAADCLTRAIALGRQVGSPKVVAFALGRLGQLHRCCARYDEAVQCGHDAIELARQAGGPDAEAEGLNSLGETQLAVGARHQARESHQGALEVARRIRDPYEEARALRGRAHALDDGPQALDHLRKALNIFTRLGVPEADETRAEIAGLQRATRSVSFPT